jgi:hypothetical protein
VVERVFSAHEFVEDPDEVLADGAADAAVVHLEDLFFGLHDQAIVDADFAEFVLDDGDALAVLGGEDVVDCAYDVEGGGAKSRRSVRRTSGTGVEPVGGRRVGGTKTGLTECRLPGTKETGDDRHRGFIVERHSLSDGGGRRVGQLGRRLIKSAPWRKRAKGFLIERRPPFIRVTSYVIVWAFISEKALP